MDSRTSSRRWLTDGVWAAVLLAAVAIVAAVDAAADRPANEGAAKHEPASSGTSLGDNLLAGGAGTTAAPEETAAAGTDATAAKAESTAPATSNASQVNDDGPPARGQNPATKETQQPPTEAELGSAKNEPQTAPPGEATTTEPPGEAATTEPPPEVATTQPPPKPPESPVTTVEWKLAEKDVLYQEVEIDRRSAFQVQGLPVSTASKYRVLSKVVVEKTSDDGTRVLRQTVLDAKLDAADELSKATIGAALKAMKGREFVITFGPHMELEKFEGQGDPPQAVPLGEPGGLEGLDLGDLGLGDLGLGDLEGLDLGGLGGGLGGGGMQGMFVASAIDDDGWKELAALSFFQPDKPPRYLGKWQRDMQHDWGPLGKWAGETAYQYKGADDDVHCIEYCHAMKYTPPGKDAGGMPFAVADARFQPQEAGGEIFFDTRAGRVHSAAEVFHVQGQLAITLLGQDTQIGLEERQAFKVRIHDENPWEE